MNIETVITVTHFSVSVKQLIGFLRACIDFPRTCFWAAGTSSPRLLPNFSSIWLPANLVLGSQHLFSALAAQLLEYLASRELTFGQSVPLHHACCPTSRVLASRELTFGQPVPLLRACCPISRVFGFSRTWFWAADTFSP